MPRQARIKALNKDAFYHVRARTARELGSYPLEREGAREKLDEVIRFYLRAYFCDLASYQIMGSHYHGVFLFRRPTWVSRTELLRRARLLYPRKSLKEFERWSDEKWQRFAERLFDISKLMQNIQQAYAQWYNKHFGRRGHFWGERFQSTLLVGEQAVLEGMLYVDLNAFRAHLCDLPWDWRWGSAWHRERNQDSWLLPLDEAVKSLQGGNEEYRTLLALRAGVPSKKGDQILDEKLLHQEYQRGIYARRRRCFSAGGVLGGRDDVLQWLPSTSDLQGRSRRREPVEQLGIGLYSLRAPRESDEDG